jgi:hypothetical protein
MSDETDTLTEWGAWDVMDEDEETHGARPRLDTTKLVARYKHAQTVRVGEKFACPSCSKMLTKKTYQHTFCRNKGRGNCKDFFWNRVSEARLTRAQDWAIRL